MIKNKYDLIVIGAGSGGLGIALGMLEMGFKVLMVDKSEEKIGGECLNTGCVPSKALIHVANIIHQSTKASDFGIKSSGAPNIHKVKKYIESKQNTIRRHENVDYFREKGLDVVIGTAQFSSKNSLEINNGEYSAKNIIIATGSKPRQIEIEGLKPEITFTNESIFEIDFIPKNFLFIGAGPVSMELGQAFSRLGSKVFIVDRGERILKKEDPVISEVLFKKLEEENITFYLNAEVEKITNDGLAEIKNKQGELVRQPIDAVFMGIGRELNFESLQLEKAEIKTVDGKIVLNNKLQTSNKNVFVSGDAADNFKFSHAAEMHNMLLLNNFLSPFKKKLEKDKFPWVTFTNPEVATFGLGEIQLINKSINYERLEIDFSENDRGTTDDFEYGKLLLFIEKKMFLAGSAKILGGSLVAPNAGEIAQELILVNSAGIAIKKIMNKTYPYPTAADLHKKIIRDRMVKDLKPWMKKVAQMLYNI
ncbi:dihydrolipoyl dehydrogenase family protein [Gillisia hiemivivida]|uniref:NAD(P)/FAD-dependent oxidoreductase n=1 Tax=Gillisia hiemivivida TaxID=291190 RepID=A0A5C7A1S5_9FLAO|nr:NAD(P)/FAD-dependent oxidoreductase [Gillisia hiemivivida]TXD95692.1 NAD(P)/FAD-dependent oxidoreductase [Gillisia hiemivivida]